MKLFSHMVERFLQRTNFASFSRLIFCPFLLMNSSFVSANLLLTSLVLRFSILDVTKCGTPQCRHCPHQTSGPNTTLNYSGSPLYCLAKPRPIISPWDTCTSSTNYQYPTQDLVICVLIFGNEFNIFSDLVVSPPNGAAPPNTSGKEGDGDN